MGNFPKHAATWTKLQRDSSVKLNTAPFPFKRNYWPKTGVVPESILFPQCVLQTLKDIQCVCFFLLSCCVIWLVTIYKTRRFVYRTHVSMGRSSDSSFIPTKTIIFALFHLMPRRFFLQILGAHFQSNSLKTQAAATFFSSLFALHESRCHELAQVVARWVFPTPLPCSNVCMETLEKSKVAWTLLPHPTTPIWKCKRTGSSVAWTYVLQEQWQQSSMNVCMEVLENSRVAWTLLPHPTPPHPTPPHPYGSARELAAT